MEISKNYVFSLVFLLSALQVLAIGKTHLLCSTLTYASNFPMVEDIYKLPIASNIISVPLRLNLTAPTVLV